MKFKSDVHSFKNYIKQKRKHSFKKAASNFILKNLIIKFMSVEK